MERKVFYLETKEKIEFSNITRLVEKAILNYGEFTGMVNIFIPHTTASVTINESADPDVVYDLKVASKRVSPKMREFMHREGNSDAHFLASLYGCSLAIPVENSKIMLGMWQGIYLCEFDGPRKRQIILTLIDK